MTKQSGNKKVTLKTSKSPISERKGGVRRFIKRSGVKSKKVGSTSLKSSRRLFPASIAKISRKRSSKRGQNFSDTSEIYDESSVDVSQIKLPDSVVSALDMAILVKDVEAASLELTESEIRRTSSKTKASERISLSESAREFLRANNLSTESSADLGRAVTILRNVKAKQPVVHMTFAVLADRESLELILKWVRDEINPLAVLDVRLQPSLVSGVYIRTTNKVFDHSLRYLLQKNRDMLVKHIGGAYGSR